jgi:hypothetical protein
VTWLPRPLRGERDTPMSLALGLALLLSIQPSDTGPNRLAVIGTLFIAFLLSLRVRLGWAGIGVLLVVGVGLRLGIDQHRASDVLDVTAAAIRQVLEGLNPWGHGYIESRPAGAPLPYGPLEIFWYMPGVGDPREIELFVSCGLLALFAVRGRPVGLAVYATAPTVILTAVDGSNDTSAGLLILAALVLAAKKPWLGAAVLGAAIAFKPYALAWAPALLAFGGLPAAIAFAVSSFALWTPFLIVWGLDHYLLGIQMADDVKRVSYYSVGVIWQGITQRAAPHELLDKARLIIALGITVTGLMFAKSVDRVIVIGTIIFIVIMYFGFWGSYAYFGAIAPILCWRLDDWLQVAPPDFLAGMPWAKASPSEDAAAAAIDVATPEGAST